MTSKTGESPSFRAVQCVEFGDPDRLVVREIQELPLEPDEVRYRVEAFALNRADLMFMRGQHYTVPRLPSRIGQEAAGVVTAVGAAVSRFKVGDRVTAIPFHTLKHGVQGESATTPEEYLTLMPDGTDAVHACTIWMQYLTPWFAFVELAKLSPGDTVLVTAAASTAGLGAIQVAKLLGVKVIATVRNPAKAEALAKHGADAVVVTGRDDIAAAVQRVADGRGITAAFDPIAGNSLDSYVELLARGAVVISCGALSEQQPVVPLAAMVRADAKFYPYSMFNHVTDPVQRDRACAEILAAIERGALRPVIDRVFEFDELLDAYEYMESNAQMGKIVVRV